MISVTRTAAFGESSPPPLSASLLFSCFISLVVDALTSVRSPPPHSYTNRRLILFVFLKQIILAVEEWDLGVHEDLTGSGDHQSMQHFSQVRKEAHILLTASQQAHPQA
jgi:hypothetical protein